MAPINMCIYGYIDGILHQCIVSIDMEGIRAIITTNLEKEFDSFRYRYTSCTTANICNALLGIGYE